MTKRHDKEKTTQTAYYTCREGYRFCFVFEHTSLCGGCALARVCVGEWGGGKVGVCVCVCVCVRKIERVCVCVCERERKRREERERDVRACVCSCACVQLGVCACE